MFYLLTWLLMCIAADKAGNWRGTQKRKMEKQPQILRSDV